MILTQLSVLQTSNESRVPFCRLPLNVEAAFLFHVKHGCTGVFCFHFKLGHTKSLGPCLVPIYLLIPWILFTFWGLLPSWDSSGIREHVPLLLDFTNPFMEVWWLPRCVTGTIVRLSVSETVEICLAIASSLTFPYTPSTILSSPNTESGFFLFDFFFFLRMESHDLTKDVLSKSFAMPRVLSVSVKPSLLQHQSQEKTPFVPSAFFAVTSFFKSKEHRIPSCLFRVMGTEIERREYWGGSQSINIILPHLWATDRNYNNKVIRKTPHSIQMKLCPQP